MGFLFKKKKNSSVKEYVLNSETLDEIVQSIIEFAKKNKIKDVGANRYGFMADDALFCMLQSGGEGRTVKVELGYQMRKPVVHIRMQGPKIPIGQDTENYGNYQNSLIVKEGCLPDYSYEDETNCVTIHLKKETGMILKIAIVLFVAMRIAVLGTILLSPEQLLAVSETIIDPIINVFFNLLRCISGPMVFLSVVWGIIGVGNQKTFGHIGKKVLLFCCSVTLVGAIIGACFFPALGGKLTSTDSSMGQFSSLFNLVLSIIPSNIIEPFSSGNTLQIIFLAMVVGIAIIALREKVSGIVEAVDQINSVVNYLMYFVGKLIPYIVFFMSISIVWAQSYKVLGTMWKFAIVMLASFVTVVLAILVFTSLRHRISLLQLIKLNRMTFIISFATASSAASFGQNLTCAKEKCGINEDLAGFAIPLGMIMHNPVAACYNTLIVMYFAIVYNVECSVSWLITGILVCAVVAISSPPIPGGAAMVYTLLFSQMGIPDEALAIALVLDIMTDFFVTAFETYILPVSLINIAGSLHMLDKDALRKTRI